MCFGSDVVAEGCAGGNPPAWNIRGRCCNWAAKHLLIQAIVRVRIVVVVCAAGVLRGSHAEAGCGREWVTHAVD